MQKIGVHDVWATPLENIGGKSLQSWFDKFGIHPDLDVCATSNNKKCKYFFTKHHNDTADPTCMGLNGLEREWHHNYFANFPYSEISKWMEHAYYQSRVNNVSGIILCFAKTDTRWWWNWVMGEKHEKFGPVVETYWIKGRVRFLDSSFDNCCLPVLKGKQGKNCSPYPSCFVVFRPRNIGDKREMQFFAKHHKDKQLFSDPQIYSWSSGLRQ